MFGFKRTQKFIKDDGSFDNTRFRDLLEMSKKAALRKRPGSAIKKAPVVIVLGGISPKEIWQFINKLANFLNSGIDLKTAFSIVHKQVKNPKLQRVIADIRSNLDHGLSISDTLRQHSKYFDPLIIALVEVGEKTGTLPRVISELETTLLENIEIKAKIKGAMIYPAILLSLSMGMVVFMLTFILPKITESFKKSGVEVPGLTQFMINVSDFLIQNWLMLVIGLVGVIVMYIFAGRTYYGQLIIGRIALKIPVFGYISRMMNVILFINSLNLLLESGVLMLEALETTANVVPNIHYKKDIIRIKNEVETGIKMSVAMGLSVESRKDASQFKNAYFPEDLVHMVNVGEETGTLGSSIYKVGQNYQKELRRFIANIMAALEPIIIVFVGAIVGVIVLSIMLPFFNLGKVASKL
ncbi:MAG: type II secretion system F family protein [Candidatus Gracilibacteria bacterium]|nr:type II secretion system F family protein [Candidatus Gracilibacteria bacterium]